MKEKNVALGVVLAMVVGFASFASAKQCYDPYHKGPVGLLYLIEKDAEWNPSSKVHRVDAYYIWGEEFSFLFEGHGLVRGEKYTLIYYPDPWPGAGLICLGEGTAHGWGGNVAIWEEKIWVRIFQRTMTRRQCQPPSERSARRSGWFCQRMLLVELQLTR